ncbi:MAG: PQQ-binding-like beta-propeller repeat protein, partial [Spirochaetales bacterium]|nr:PQQ-binding-like beta-propeller repeat protein [Spirochaetales bacterium]
FIPFLLLCFFSSLILSAHDWPQWRGPNRDNLSQEKGLLKQWPKDGPVLLWKATGCGKGYSSVSIANGRIYTAGIINQQTHVLAFNTTGKLIWSVQNGPQWKAESWMSWAAGYDGSRATPTVADEVVYHLSETGQLLALNAETGKKIWTKSITAEFKADVPEYGYAESVFIDGDKLLCYPGGSDGYMIALNRNTGKLIWANKIIGDKQGYASIIKVEFSGVTMAVTMTEEAAIGVDMESGRLLWRYEIINQQRLNIATPLHQDGHVYVTSGYGKGGALLKLYKDKETVKVREVWFNKELDNHHGGVIVYKNRIYGTGHDNGGWICLDFLSGKKIYRTRDVGKGSLTCADSLLYCLSETGNMGLVDPAGDEYTVISQFKVPRDGRGPFWAHPVISDCILYVRHNDSLYAYKIKK